MTKLEKKVEELLEPKINELGYELYDVEYVKEGKDNFLRIFIDKENGIDLNDCEKVNNEINSLLDEADYIKEMYFLEVSSPGIERVLRQDKHFKANIGKKVEIRLFKKVNNLKEIIGTLKEVNDNCLKLEYENEILEIERTNISLVKTVYDW